MDALSPLLEMMKGVGSAAPVCAILLWGWWAERSERKELSDKVFTLASTAVAAEQQMAHSLDMLAARLAK